MPAVFLINYSIFDLLNHYYLTLLTVNGTQSCTGQQLINSTMIGQQPPLGQDPLLAVKV
jgi:hypothetical protein